MLLPFPFWLGKCGTARPHILEIFKASGDNLDLGGGKLLIIYSRISLAHMFETGVVRAYEC